MLQFSQFNYKKKDHCVCLYNIQMRVYKDTHAPFASLYFPKTGVSP